MSVALVPFFAGIPVGGQGDFDLVPKEPAILLLVTILVAALGSLLQARIRRRRSISLMPPTDLTATAKFCGYCGRENDLVAIHCWECGTPFPTPQIDQDTSERDAATA